MVLYLGMINLKKVLPPTYFFLTVLLCIILHLFVPVKKIAAFPLNQLGLIFILIGIVLNLWTDKMFSKEKTTVKPFKEPKTLITSGPFKISRHPMYLGFVLILLGLSVFLGSLSCFIAPILMFIICNKLYITNEEKSLEKVFGQRYLDYKNQVKKWL